MRHQSFTRVDNFTFYLQHLWFVLPVSLNRMHSLCLTFSGEIMFAFLASCWGVLTSTKALAYLWYLFPSRGDAGNSRSSGPLTCRKRWLRMTPCKARSRVIAGMARERSLPAQRSYAPNKGLHFPCMNKILSNRAKIIILWSTSNILHLKYLNPV